MLPTESPRNGVSGSLSNQVETVSSVLPENESGILQQKKISVCENCESEADKGPTVVKDEQHDLNQRQSPDAGNPLVANGESEILDGGDHATIPNQVSVVPKKELISDGGHASVCSKKAIPENGNPVSQFNQVLVLPKKVLDPLKQNLTPDVESHTPTSVEKLMPETGIHESQLNQVSLMTKMDPDCREQGQGTDAAKTALVPCEAGSTDSPVPEKSLQHMQSTRLHVCIPSSNQEQMTYSARPEKILHKLQPRRNPDSGSHTPQSEQGSHSPRIREKASDDGYNWRKYGQKLVKGNVFVRSYYKCTYSNCRAKKQVETSHDGHLTDIKYIGKHEHPKMQSSPQSTALVSPSEVRKADISAVAASEAEDEPSTAPCGISQTIEPAEPSRELTATENNNNMGGVVSQSHNPRDGIIDKDDTDNDSCPNSKRQKREFCNIDDTQVKKTFYESRQVVQMMSEVDIVNDGYRWRKYGQKLVKGNPNPRSYYRCSTAGCTVKKHVERASHDPKVVITTYEGKHDHDKPGSRTVVLSTAESGNRPTTNGEARSELGEHKPVGMDMIVNIGAN